MYNLLADKIFDEEQFTEAKKNFFFRNSKINN